MKNTFGGVSIMIKFLQIGKIVNTHGIRGELKIIPLTDDPKDLIN